jgi:hypothetical protein
MTTSSPRRFNLASLFSDRLVLGILLGAFVTAIAFSSYAHFNAEGAFWDWGWLDSFAQNAGTEMLGAFLTFLLIEVLVTQRRQAKEKSEASDELRHRLIRRMGSQVNEEALHAAGELRAYGWLEDGTLRGADLRRANLQSAHLFGASLPGADLDRSNLNGADLRGANLQDALLNAANLHAANVIRANLQGAFLSLAHLQVADLRGANLEGAVLDSTNLKGADLRGARLLNAHLHGADLTGAVFNHHVKLPDGSQWSPNTDLTRFTDPNRTDSWREDAAEMEEG